MVLIRFVGFLPGKNPLSNRKEREVFKIFLAFFAPFAVKNLSQLRSRENLMAMKAKTSAIFPTNLGRTIYIVHD
jgi:hypothetical protein